MDSASLLYSLSEIIREILKQNPSASVFDINKQIYEFQPSLSTNAYIPSLITYLYPYVKNSCIEI